MVKKKVDSRVRGLIEYNVKNNHRSLFILVGDHGKDQVENIHKILSKTRIKARPSVLWCYKKELGFSTHRKKRMKEIKNLQKKGVYDTERDDPFELFITTTTIRWTYYKETDKVLGQTFGMCVLQDFEALTPNLLARTIETVEGGGIIIILIKTVKSLRQLYTLTMDVHSRYRTEAHHEVVPRFNERFILSLGDCQGCLVLDDELNILPISSKCKHIPTYDSVTSNGLQEGQADASGYLENPELIELKQSIADTPLVCHLIDLCRTVDQAKAVLSFLDTITDKSLRTTVCLTAARGRGKSAAIGLCLAGAVASGYSSIFVTAPSPENLKTVFEFLVSGLKALKYHEHLDFEVLQENHGEFGKVVTRLNVFRNHRQTVQYIQPHEHSKLSQAELVAIDEAAAIPLPIVKKLFGPHLVFLSSTINGYEGTGRSLSLKLIQQLRVQQGAMATANALEAGQSLAGTKNKGSSSGSSQGRHLHEDRWKASATAAASLNSHSGASTGGGRRLSELSLDTPIRYAVHDPIEKWLNQLLCLDVTTSSHRMVHVMPAPRDCELYIVDRDALFSYHPLSESLLQRIWTLYTAAHYKNSPNDLQMLSDAPAHRLFLLLGPTRSSGSNGSSSLPDVLCVVQVAFEGLISQKSVQSELSKGHKASGDLIPWTIAQQFNDSEFASLSGARIVRIATHPDVQKMGYGSRAIDLLIAYFQGELTVETISPSSGLFGGEGGRFDHGGGRKKENSDDEEEGGELHVETIEPRKKLPSLLTAIVDRPAERLHWLGSSFGLTTSLLSFWTKRGFKVCYVRQTINDLTGEYSSIVLRELHPHHGSEEGRLSRGWVNAFVTDYRRRLIHLMSYSLRSLDLPLVITLLDPDRKITSNATPPSLHEVDASVDALVDTSVEGTMGTLTATELTTIHLTLHDMKRLELYARNMVDHHMILDMVPILTQLMFQGRIPALHLSYLQVAILAAVGLQHRDVDSIAGELDLPVSQVLAFFNKSIRKIGNIFKEMIERQTARDLLPSKAQQMAMEERVEAMLEATNESLAADQLQDEKEFTKKIQRELIMSNRDVSKHVIKAADDDLQEALNRGVKTQLTTPSMVSVQKTWVSDKDGEERGKKDKNSEKKRLRHDTDKGKSKVKRHQSPPK